MAQYCCKWNEHVPNLLTGITSLKDTNNYVDVTLLCGGHAIKVHKLILSTCSRVFHDLFTSNPCPHPVIILQDMKVSILQAIVDFIYRGEINIRNDELELLSRAAKALGIKGLSDICKEVLLGALISDIEEGLQSNDVSVNDTSLDQPPPKKRARKRSHDEDDPGSDHGADLDTVSAAASPQPEESGELNSEINQTFTFSFGPSGISSFNDSLNAGSDSVAEDTPIKKNAATHYEANPAPGRPPIMESMKKGPLFSPQVDGVSKGKRRSVIWNFFTPLNETIAKCNSCKINKSYQSSISNLRKHLRLKHPSIDLEYAEQLQACNKIAGRKTKTGVPMQNFVAPSLVAHSGHSDNPSDFPRKKTSVIWKYFTRKPDMTAQCNACKTLKSFRASISNLKKHIQRKHPSIDLGNSSMNDDGENIELPVEPVQKTTPPKAKPPRKKPVSTAGQKKSYLWNFFTPLNDGVAVCNICLKNKSYKSSISNLKKHLVNKHPSLDLQSAQELQELAERNRFQSQITEVETYTAVVAAQSAMTVEEAMNEGIAEETAEQTAEQTLQQICNNVSEVVATEPINTVASTSQGKAPHSQLGKKKSYLWNFFTPLSDDIASCKICSAEKSYRSSISNLKKHLQRSHSNIKLPSATNSSQGFIPQLTIMAVDDQLAPASANEEVLQEITVQANMLSVENSMLSPFILKLP